VPPQAKQGDWIQTDIDRFILARRLIERGVRFV
jgi:hypothetical protein